MPGELKWGSLVLHNDDPLSAAYSIETLGAEEGMDLGNPQANVVSTLSLLQDGALAQVANYDNRSEIVIPLRLKGSTGANLGLAEQLLETEVQRDLQSALTYTPPTATSPTAVFDVVYSMLDQVFDDFKDVKYGERFYNLRLTCLPFARSANEVTVAAIGNGVDPGAPTTATIADGSSTTGFTGTGSVSTSGGAVLTSLASSAGTVSLFLKFTVASPPLSLTATPYVYVDYKVTSTPAPSSSAGSQPVLRVDSTDHLPIATGPATVAGYTRAYYLSTDLSATDFTFTTTANKKVASGSATYTLAVDQIVRTSAGPFAGTGRQLLRSIAIDGSAPTQATLALEHTTSALGDVIAYVYKNDNPLYSPSMRQYRSGGGSSVTADTTTVSGAREDAMSSVLIDIPVGALPLGSYEILMRVKATVNGTYNVSCVPETYVNGVLVGGPGQMVTAATVTTTAYIIVSLGVVNLRSVKVGANSTAIVRLTLNQVGGSGGLVFDEGWFFNLDIGALTRVSCGTAAPSSGGTSNRLFLNPATLASDGLPSLLRGFAADQSDAFFPAFWSAWNPPQFEPSVVGLFTVTTNALNVAASARYYPRWHTYPAA